MCDQARGGWNGPSCERWAGGWLATGERKPTAASVKPPPTRAVGGQGSLPQPQGTGHQGGQLQGAPQPECASPSVGVDASPDSSAQPAQQGFSPCVSVVPACSALEAEQGTASGTARNAAAISAGIRLYVRVNLGNDPVPIFR